MSTIKVNTLDTRSGTTITVAAGKTIAGTDIIDTAQISADAVTSTEIADDAVTTAKLANSINTEITANTAKVTNATHTGDVTGATALTIATDAVDIAMLSATGTASATTFLRGDNSWATITEGIGTASHWQVASSIDTVDGENIFSGTWNEKNRVGSAMTVSSGVFTFPSTGIWSIRATLDANRSAASPYWRFRVYYTTNDGGAWTLGQLGSGQFAGSDGYCNIAIIYSFDVTDVSTHKVRFACELNSDNGVATTSSGPNAVFERWGDT